MPFIKTEGHISESLAGDKIYACGIVA